MTNHHWLNLNEAAEVANCSRKTLYRYMEKGVLAYRKESNNRRYVQRKHLEKLFPFGGMQKNKTLETLADFSQVINLLEKLSADLEAQSTLLERMITLYKPKTFAELVSKHRRVGEQ